VYGIEEPDRYIVLGRLGPKLGSFMHETLLSKKITLTFDNGPTPGVTDRVLDMLSQRHMSAIFSSWERIFPRRRDIG
jgi:peptidoglycan/xylan/chitin deacetylase (PgdA/CDA1 family)